MTAKIYIFDGETRLDLHPDQVLEQACGKLEKVIILGLEPDGSLYMAASCGKVPEALYLLEKCKQVLLNAGD